MKRAFTGKVEDYTLSDQLLMSGTYTENGSKTGRFISYYPSGKLQSEGSFVNNLRDGIWKYYYENGNIEHEVNFTPTSFTPINAYDSTGQKILSEGTGKWHFEYKWFKVFDSFIVEGNYIDGKKEGEWICKVYNTLFYREIYKRDNFIKGEVRQDGQLLELSEPVNNKAMLPYKFEITETLTYTASVSKKDYPFLGFLPDEKPASADSLDQASDKQVFYAVEEHAEFPGGTAAMFKFIMKNLKYPKDAWAKGIEGKVFVKFIVDKEGNVSNVEIMKGLSPSTDKEAIRLVSSFPKWSPGRQNGRAVKSQFILPIPFRK